MESVPGWQQVAHVVGGVGQLAVTELLDPAPVAALGLLIELHPHQLLHHLLEAVAGAVGAGQAAGHLGAEQGRHGDAEPLGQGGHIKAGEVEHLLDGRCLHQLLEQGRLGLPPGDADAADVVLVVADLHQTQAIAAMHQPHRLRIHRQGPGGPQ